MRYTILPTDTVLPGQPRFALRLEAGPTLVFDRALDKKGDSKLEPHEAELDDTTVVQLRNDGYQCEPAKKTKSKKETD